MSRSPLPAPVHAARRPALQKALQEVLRISLHTALLAPMALAAAQAPSRTTPPLSPASAAPQALRDPMQPPAALRPPGPSGSAATAVALPESAQVLVVDGKAFAVIGSRRHAQGARIGSGADALVVERVNEHGVWLRSRDGLHALPMTSGVSKKPSPESGSPDKSQEKRDRP